MGSGENDMGDACRPESFEHFVGQEKPKKILKILWQSARRKGGVVPHVLLSGGPGLGKTTLARIVAAEMGSRLVEVVASNLQSPDEMAKHLMRLKPKDVLFIDEIHGLPRGVEEVLYGALEDGRIPVVQRGYDEMLKGLGLGGRRQQTIAAASLPPFTCIGATTLSGLISDPLRSRFVQVLQLEPYSDAELALIVMGAASKLDFGIDGSMALEVARRSRATARTAISNVRWLAEYCEGTGAEPTLETLDEAFALKEITPQGLTKVDLAYLTSLAEAEEPMGLSTLAAATGESEETLALAVEPFLIRKGLVRKTGRGRMATAKAAELMAAKEGGREG
jgi:Holliday junction DNA helicase RuvB